MKKKVLTILLTVLMYLSAVALGMSAVFRVDAVSIQATVASEETKAQIKVIQEELRSLYHKESTISVKKNKAESLLEKYPYLRMTEFKKSYPDTLYIKIVEDTEAYAVQTDEGYYILSEEGIVVEKRTTPVNRFDGADNLLIKGLQVTGTRGGTLSGDPCLQAALTLCKGMDETLGGIRKNVLSVEVLKRSAEVFYRITMREGVKIYIDTPEVLTSEKSSVAVERYLSLSDEQRMNGCINLHVIDGKVSANYQPTDNFEF